MNSKLRLPLGVVYPIALILAYIFALLEILIVGKPLYSVLFYGVFFIVIGVIQYSFYHMWEYLVLGILAGTSTWHSMSYFYFPDKTPITFIIHIQIIVLFVIIFWSRLSAQERLFNNSRRFFKLASGLISDTSGGFTSRPYSGGGIDIRDSDLNGFVNFIEGKYIAKAYKKENVYYLGFSMGISPLVVDNPLEISHVRIDQNRKLSVSISDFDYRQYRESLNFDQLCQSMSEVFLRFIEYYKEGKEARIVSELKSKK